MNPVHPGDPGATRKCPHCRETILESAMVCPACRHHLRYGASTDAPASALTITAFGLRMPANSAAGSIG